MILDVTQDMRDYLPRYYGDSAVVMNIVDREAAEIIALNDAIQDVLAQYFIDTATWGLANWERVCGLITDEAKPIDQRRSVLKSKLRGVGTVTAELVKTVAESYNNGEVSVTEDAANYLVKITFISNRGVPANLTDIQSALRDIIPAHLAITFEFTYMTWSALDAKTFTWDSLTTHNYTWSQFETL
ncbi:putative phage tail protein [Paenibacillus sp. SI8]|uniref:putative phage tail protein n=1 Tax=unclassified Paenibacillus TaxID=185978 RepID=UPI0034658AA2